jgi:hypothetical protein
MADYVKIRTTDPDGGTANITQLCQSIVWAGDYRNAARTLTFSPVRSLDDSRLPRPPTALGGAAQLWQESDLLFDGYSLERTRDTLGKTIDVVAYDRGLYLTRNSVYLRVQGQTPEAVTAALCREYGIEAGTLAQTGVTLTRNFLNVTLYKIIMTLYSLAADQTGEKYALRFRGKRLEVARMEQSDESLILKPGSNLWGCVAREKASGITNSVGIYDDEGNLTDTQADSESVALYGLMQAAIKASAYDDPVAHAKSVLADNGLSTTITLTCAGDTRLITGSTVVVREPETEMDGLFWILSDRHQWSGGVYQTKLTVSLQAVMDTQSAGSDK